MGDRIEIAALDVLDALIEAAYTKDRMQQLCCGACGILCRGGRLVIGRGPRTWPSDHTADQQILRLTELRNADRGANSAANSRELIGARSHSG
jgi:hypothetical protein